MWLFWALPVPLFRSQQALSRIELTLYGVFIYVLVSMVVFPVKSSTQVLSVTHQALHGSPRCAAMPTHS